MVFNQVALLAAAGAIGAFWNQFRNIVYRLFSLFVRTDTLADPLPHLIIEHVLPDLTLYSWGNRTYRAWNTYKDGKEQELFYSYNKSYLARYKKSFIYLTSTDDALNITYLCGTFSLEKFMAEANEKVNAAIKAAKPVSYDMFYISEVSGDDSRYDNKPDSRAAASTGEVSYERKATPNIHSSSSSLFSTFHFFKQKARFHGMSWEEYIEGMKSKKKDTEEYYWSKEALKLEDELCFWMSNKAWYQDRGLQWKRGVLLKGKPGTGKTRMVVACAKKHRLRIVKFNISNMSNTEFLDSISKIGSGHSESPPIILIEDIDCVFDGRTNVLAGTSLNKQLLSFDTLINGIAGAKNSLTAFVVITTNRPEVLDEALVRAGRVDAQIEVPYLATEGKSLIAKNILRDWPGLIEKLIDIPKFELY